METNLLSAEILSGTERGRNLTLPPCYPDTCVLVDAFLENPQNHSDPKKVQKITNAQTFFKLYDGRLLLTSPMVIAEFIGVATHPEKFKMSHEKAVELVDKLFKDEHFSLSVPKVNLHNIPSLSLPFFDYSIKLTGKSKIDNKTIKTDMTFGKGHLFRNANYIPSPEHSLEDVCKNADWDSATLSSVLYDLLISASIEATSTSGGSLQFQDAFVLLFGRGHKYVHFVTSDEKLVNRTGTKPYQDLEVHELSTYLKTIMVNATGSNKI